MARSSKKNKGCLSFLFGLGSDDRDDQAGTSVPADVKAKEPFPFRLRDDFLSSAEHSFYMVLKSMMGTYFTICPKVSLSDIFFVTHPDRNMSAYNKINRKHVDFLICEAETMKPRFAIELDDKSHNRQDRIERDEFVEELFETASLPLVRSPVRQTYHTGELGVLFREAMAEKPKVPTGQPFTVPVTGPMGERPTIPLSGRSTTPLPEPACPAQFSSAGVEAKNLPST